MSTRPWGTHPVNVAHLVVGLVFLGIAGAWALDAAGVVDTGNTSWTVPLILVLAGAAGLVATVARGLRGSRARTAGPVRYAEDESADKSADEGRQPVPDDLRDETPVEEER